MARAIEGRERRASPRSMSPQLTGGRHLITVGSGVIAHEASVSGPRAGATVTTTRPELLLTLPAGSPAGPRIEAGHIKVEGDAALYVALAEMIEPLVPNFPIVTP